MNKPKLVIPRKVYDKVLHWCITAKGLEISGLGKCKYDAKTNTFEVIDAQVLQQSIQSAGNTEITAEAIGKFMYDTRDQGHIVWWWHSHHSMGAFWSSTDRDCIASFGKDGGVVATVFNNRGETLSACQFKCTTILGETQLFHDALDMQIVTYYDTDLFKQWESEYEAAKLKYDPLTVTKYEPTKYLGWANEMPPKRLRKRWEKLVPEDKRHDIIFEDPKGDDWVWMQQAKSWRKVVENDYLRIASYFIEDQIITDNQQTKLFSEAELAQIEAEEDDDMPLKANVNDVLDQMYSERARTYAGMSAKEWDLLTEYERSFYMDRVDWHSQSDM